MKINKLSWKLLLLVTFGAILAGCKDSRCEVSQGIGDKEISFSSNISLSPMRAYDNTWEQGDLISIYMLKSGVPLNANLSTSDLYYKGVNYKTAQKGMKVNFEPATNADKMFFPKAQDVDFVAFYPASLTPTSDHTIMLNMASRAVDLLYSNNAKNKNRNTTASDLLLTFKHALSSICVSLVDAQNKAIEAATIKVQGFKTEGTFALNDGTLSNLQGSAELSLIPKNQKFESTVLPQKIATNQAKIVITNSGKNYEYAIPEITYNQGRRVSYKLKLQGNSVEAIISGQITDWEEVNGGDATLTPSTPSSDVSSFSVSSTSLNFNKEGGTQTLTVTTDAASFTATASQPWLKVTADVPNNKVTVVCEKNTSAEERTATIKLEHNGVLRAAPKTITVNVRQSASGETPQPKGWDGGVIKLREASKAGKTKVEEELIIEAVVLNNVKENNNSSKNLIVSDGKAGIAIRLKENADKSIKLGTVLKITIPAGTELARYKGGTLQLNNLPNSSLQILQKVITIEPIEVTFADLMSDRISDDLESRLVKVSGVQFQKAGIPFKGDKNTYHPLVESSASQPAPGFSLPAVFASSYNKWNLTIPEGNGTIVGATSFSTYNSKKGCNLFIRSVGDLQLNGPRK